MEENPDTSILYQKDERTTVSAKIGEEYKDWKEGDIILISAPTGSGKSYFIFHVLLDYVIDLFLEKQIYLPIYYFVNRRILKDQLLEELKHKIQPLQGRKKEGIRVKDFIKIETYQNIENQCKKPNPFTLFRTLEYRQNRYTQRYAFTVYDECHYFLSDSIYNTSTQLSFWNLTVASDKNIQIYMSATIKDIKESIKYRYSEDIVNMYLSVTNNVDHYHASTKDWQIREYLPIEADYHNINLHAINGSDSVKPLIQNNMRKGKWLIFVDSINYGKELYKSLVKDESLKDDVVFIDAEYEKNPDASTSVDEIAKNKYINKKVVICTSVLDNGVSFNDNCLRNVIILTDTEEEFIQMLGRKRFDGKSVNLYICKRNRKYFTDRLGYVKKTRDIVDSYEDIIPQLVYPLGKEIALSRAVSDLQKVNNDYYSIDNEVKRSFASVHNGMSLNEAQALISNNLIALANKHMRLLSSLVEKWNSFLSAEQELRRLRQEFSDKLFSSEYLYNHIKKFCYVSRDCFHVNKFSVRRLEMLENYYDDMNEEMCVDENAFLKKQAEWLGRTFEDIEIISDEHPLTDQERADALSDVADKLRKLLHKEMDDKARETFCVEAKDSLMMLLGEMNTEEAKRHRGRIYHKELSGECLEYIVNVFNLPFVLNGKRGYKVLEDRFDPNLTPTGGSDSRELGTEGGEAPKKKP